LRRDGFWSAGSLREGFQCAVATNSMHNTLYNYSRIDGKKAS
jgi:hypothetical protein